MDDVLAGLAANPAAPPDVLCRLAARRPAAVRIAWRQANLPDTVVERLLAIGDSTIALALDSSRQSPATRRRIAEHPEMREARSRFSDGLAGLVHHEDPVLREAVAVTGDDMPVASRRKLLADEATLGKVASYATLTAEAVRTCLAGEEDLRAKVAVNPTLPAAARDRLAQDPSPYVRSRVLLRQDLAEERRRQLHAVLLAERENDFGDVDIALTLLDHDEPSWLPSRPLSERISHLESSIPCFRRCAARSADLPTDVVRRLHAHEDVQVRRIVAARADTPGDVLERLVSEHGEHPKFRPRITEHPNFPPEAFTRLATNDDARRRVLAAAGADLPTEVITALACDPDAFVRSAAARHRRIPVLVLDTLLTDGSPDVAKAAGANPALPVDRMRALLDRAGL
ncbi:hypothetical protein ACPZ19_05175 [Amycolatopsis lurida]